MSTSPSGASSKEGNKLTCVSALLPEIWKMVGETIRSKKTLMQLSMTCKQFREIFEPLVYSYTTLQLEDYEPRGEIGLEDSWPQKMFHCVKEFRVCAFEFSEGIVDYDESMNSNYASDISQMIQGMPKLERFCWSDMSFEDYRLTGVTSHPDFLSALTEARYLKHIHLNLGQQYLELDTGAAWMCFIPLKGFKNLTSLEIYQFYCEPDGLARQIAEALTNSPNLRCLGLGLSCDATAEFSPEIYLVDSAFQPLLENICLEYSFLKGKPLQLETLRLGHGIEICSSKDPQIGNYLEKLFEIPNLKTLHLYNGRVTEDLDAMEDYGILLIDWKLLKDCDSLHQLSVSMLGEDVTEWMNKCAVNIKELIVIYSGAITCEEVQNLFRLNHRLETIFASEPMWATSAEEDEWSRTESSASDDGNTANEPSEAHRTNPSDLDTEEMSITTDTPDMKSDKAPKTFLGYLQKNPAISKIVLDIDLQNDWENFSSVLPNLKNLTYLFLSRRLDAEYFKTHNELSPLPVMSTPDALAHHYAQAIKEKCPSLQYIRIGKKVWQYIVDWDPEKKKEKLRLLRLEWEEVLALEFLSLDEVNLESGLPMKRWHPPFYD